MLLFRPNDTIQSYRNYYIYIKRYFAKWSKRDAPQWFVDGVENMSDKDKYVFLCLHLLPNLTRFREWSEKKIQSVKEGKKAKSERIKKSKQDKEAKEKQVLITDDTWSLVGVVGASRCLSSIPLCQLLTKREVVLLRKCGTY